MRSNIKVFTLVATSGRGLVQSTLQNAQISNIQQNFGKVCFLLIAQFILSLNHISYALKSIVFSVFTFST